MITVAQGRLLSLLMLVPFFAGPWPAPGFAATEQLPTGAVIDRLVCRDRPEQSYALYLPTGSGMSGGGGPAWTLAGSAGAAGAIICASVMDTRGETLKDVGFAFFGSCPGHRDQRKRLSCLSGVALGLARLPGIA